jgi:hypothetical protein
MIKLHLATLVSPWLGGRYRRQGTCSGEEFRDDSLVPLLRHGGVEVDLDGIKGPTPGFLDEALGAGLIAAVGPELATRCTVIGTANDHLVRQVMEYRAEAIEALKDKEPPP